MTALAWASMWLTVRYNYEGDWTGLFCVGGQFAVKMDELPPARVVSPEFGYDGQFYRIVAHDPWVHTEQWRAIDDPGLRYRRILLPATAWMLSGGRTSHGDAAYVGAELLWLFCGTLALAEFLRRCGMMAAWGGLFLLFPGTVASLDRMLPDVALYAIVAALLLAWRERLTAPVAALLTLAPLARDLGALAALAVAAWLAREKRWRDAAAALACLTPAVLWALWLRSQIPPTLGGRFQKGVLPAWALRTPGYGVLIRLFHPLDYPGMEASLRTVTQILDALAWLGLGAAVVMTVLAWRRLSISFPGLLQLAWTALFFFASSEYFLRDFYSWPRAFTPLVALCAWDGARRRQWWALAPLVCVGLRMLWQMGPEARAIAVGLQAAMR